MQVRKHILQALAEGSVRTSDAYVALEHEWMHLETLAYMLAQEQRLSFEKASAGGSTDGQTHPSNVSVDVSSDDEMCVKGVDGHAQGQDNSLTNGVTNSNGRVNGNSNGNVNGQSLANGHSHSVTNGISNGNSHSSSGHVPSKSASMVQIPAGDITLGTDTDPSKTFVWDNEGPRQSPQHVGSFQMASHPISNAEYYKFAVASKGYEDEEYWKAEDLACLRKRSQHCPATWTVQVLSLSFSSLF